MRSRGISRKGAEIRERSETRLEETEIVKESDITALSEYLEGRASEAVDLSFHGFTKPSVFSREAESFRMEDNRAHNDNALLDSTEGIHVWKILEPEFTGMPAPFQSTLSSSTHARLFERLDTGYSEGSTAGIFRGEMEVGGSLREVAVKVFRNPQPDPIHGTRDWNRMIDHAQGELANLEVLANLGLGPKPFGAVRTGGNFAIAMERIAGKGIDEMSPSEIKRYVTRETILQVGRMWNRLIEAGYELGDFQFAVLTEPQIVNGLQKQTGDVVFIDAGILHRSETLRAEASARGKVHHPDSADQVMERARATAEHILRRGKSFSLPAWNHEPVLP